MYNIGSLYTNLNKKSPQIHVFPLSKPNSVWKMLLESRRVVNTTGLHWLSTFDLAGSFNNVYTPHLVLHHSLKELSAMYYLNFSKSQYTLCLKSKSTIMAVEFSEDGYVSGDTIYKVCYHTPSRC